MYLRDKSNNKIDFNEEYVDLRISDQGFRWRVILVYSILAVVFGFLFINTFQLQIVEGEKSLVVASRTNQAQLKSLAPRGLIYDAKGVKLARNIPSYSLFVKPEQVPEGEEESLIREAARLFGLSEEEFYNSFRSKVYDAEGKRSTAERVTLKSDLSFDQYFALLSRIEDFPGFTLNVEPVRNYELAGYFSNILGYVGDPGKEDIEKGIYSESQVGKIGIERSYDEELRGKEGLTVTERETLTGNQTLSQVTDPTPGNNVHLAVDSNWQLALTDIIRKQVDSENAFAGAGVILKASTGEVKALVTYPNYDNNLFAKGISGKDYSTLINDPKKPLFNRPIALQLPPGSIMKIFGATAGLESGVINAETKKLSDRCIELPGKIKFCEADQSYLGWVNVKEALAKSSNIFFCNLMQDMHRNPGYGYYYDVTRNFGLGASTGIDIGGEASGLLPTAEYKKRLFNEPWYIGDECNAVIGQGYVTVTPLQMAVAVSAFVNGGNIMEPHLVSRISDQDGNTVSNIEPKVVRQLNISESTMRTVREGLRLVVTAGTAGPLSSAQGNVIAKTGSSDAGEWINGKYYSGAHSWVMGCFEYLGEEYCFTVMQQWGGRGYRTVPIMKKFINCVYNDFSNNCDAV